MAETYKILGQVLTGELALDNSTVKEVVAYEVPDNTQASISAIEITNSDTVNQTYRLALVKDAEVESSSTTVNYTVSTPENRFLVPSSATNQPLAYSTDGVTWNTTVIPETFSSILYGNNKFVAGISGSNAYYSTDSVNWTAALLPTSGWWRFGAYGDGKFVLGSSYSPNLVYSTDGVTWLSTSLPTSASWTGMTYGGGKFVAIANGSSAVAYSTDGINWSLGTMPSSTSWETVTYGNGKYVAVAYSGKAAYSVDGSAWTQVSLSGTGWWPVVYGNGKFVAISMDSTSGAYSSDGSTWTLMSLPEARGWQSLIYANGKFIVNSYNTPHAAYSMDGINWTSVSMPGSYGYHTAGYGTANLTETHTQSIPQSLNKHHIVYDKTIESGKTHEILGGITLAAGDQIRAYSSSNEIIVNVYGVELS